MQNPFIKCLFHMRVTWLLHIRKHDIRRFQPSFGDISAIYWWILMQNSVLETL
jgi:hypothetical protein